MLLRLGSAPMTLKIGRHVALDSIYISFVPKDFAWLLFIPHQRYEFKYIC